MPATDTVHAELAVSVIVPARNEEECLGACLESLVAQTGVTFEIIVVDDHSSDRTHEIATFFSDRGVRLIDAGPLPPSWTGKNNALVSGVREARGQWLLFTDADTVHLPGSLARALDEAGRHKVALVSYSPQQIAKSFWEKAIMPVIFAELASAYPPSEVTNPNSPLAAANGQYILVTRQAYAAAGGHAGIASQILEDVALARAVKRTGRRTLFRYGADMVRTRMYRNFGQLREGWTKNLALLFSSPMRLATLRATEFVLITGSFAMAGTAYLRGHERSSLVTGLLAIVLYTIFVLRIRRAHFPWDADIHAILGLPMFSYLLLRSWKSHHRGAVTWKNRTYGACAEQQIEVVRTTIGRTL